LFPAFAIITSGFIFKGLREIPRQPFFLIGQSNYVVGGIFGCYIDFSGFSASRVTYTQESPLYTTNVTVGTAGASKKRKSNRERIHGADI
jgi:hypothetical protein